MKLKIKRLKKSFLALFLALVLVVSGTLAKPIESKAMAPIAISAAATIFLVLCSIGVVATELYHAQHSDETALTDDIKKSMDEYKPGVYDQLMQSRAFSNGKTLTVPEDTWKDVRGWVASQPTIKANIADGRIDNKEDFVEYLSTNFFDGNVSLISKLRNTPLISSSNYSHYYVFSNGIRSFFIGSTVGGLTLSYFFVDSKSNDMSFMDVFGSSGTIRSMMESAPFGAAGIPSNGYILSTLPVISYNDSLSADNVGHLSKVDLYRLTVDYGGDIRVFVNDNSIIRSVSLPVSSSYNDVVSTGLYDVVTPQRTLSQDETFPDRKVLTGDYTITIPSAQDLDDVMTGVAAGTQGVTDIFPLIDVVPVDMTKGQSLVDEKPIEDVLEDLKNPAIPGTDVDVVPTGLFDWLSKILNAILALPRAIAEAIASFFVPDPNDFDDALNEIKFALLDFGGGAFDMSFLFDEESPLPDIKISSYGREVTIVSMSLVNSAIEFFRPVIRGFITLLLIFYNYNQLAGLIGQQGVSIAGLVMRDEQLAAKSKKGKDD